MSWKARDSTRFAKPVTGLPSKADSSCTPWHQKSTALSAEPRDTPSMRCKYGLIWFDIKDKNEGNIQWTSMSNQQFQLKCRHQKLPKLFPNSTCFLFLFLISHSTSPSAFRGTFVVPRSFCSWCHLCLKFRNRVSGEVGEVRDIPGPSDLADRPCFARISTCFTALGLLFMQS